MVECARALAGEDDSLVSVRPVLDRWPTRRDLLLEDCEAKFTSLREAEGIGRPLGTADFVTELERRLGRSIARRRPRSQGRGDPGGRAVQFALTGRLEPTTGKRKEVSIIRNDRAATIADFVGRR